jgi:predicted membrane-bound spermidine synthase
MRRNLCGVFFLSGAAALLFENLWFRQAGLAFGNGVWAQSLVLASFMAGLALGNVLAAWREARVLRPLRTYARLELAVAVTGVFLVITLPGIGSALAVVLGPLADRPALLNLVRLATAFALLVVPTTAMGLTLPILTKALARGGRAFGENLGALYGWNTLGALTGALAVETVLVPRVGVLGTTFAAAGLNVLAATVSLRLSRAHEGKAGPEGGPRPDVSGMPASSRRLLATAFVAGGLLLALEVVWFRFLAMFCDASSLTFSLLLAVVLAGIGCGGLAGGAWLARREAAPQALGALLAVAGLLVVALYAGFNAVPPRLGGVRFVEARPILVLAAFLTFPVSFVSGTVFTLLGEALHRDLRREGVSAGLLTLANTTGAILGALAGGFVLLPVLGMERSFALLAAGYGLAVLLLPPAFRAPESKTVQWATYGLFAAFAVYWLLFPYGLMNAIYIRTPLLLLGRGAGRILAVREGLTETAVYVEEQEQGEPLAVRLVTNGYSMSSTSWGARRYMGLYVYLPVALHPEPRRALLICYGVGSTARALVRSPELRTIDVVDISPTVVEQARVVFPDPGENPLHDPRVRVHVEDGRAFLALTGERYDLITSEPPPPTNAGVVNLYSQEYFELLKSRLAEGGFATYWLPLHVLDDSPARAVIRAFCNAFPDCTLWRGHSLDWMLVGTRGARGPVSAERVRRQWEDPRVGDDLRDLGLERPEQLGALFLADAKALARLAGAEPPVTDNWPARVGRLPRALPTPFAQAVLFEEPPRAASFAASPEVARLWPATLVPGSASSMRTEEILIRMIVERTAGRPAEEAWLHEVVTRSEARLPVLLWFQSSPDLQRIARTKEARSEIDPWVQYHRAVRALAERKPGEAAELARAALPGGNEQAPFLLAYALALDGRAGDVRPLLDGLGPRARAFLEDTFALGPPRESAAGSR